MHFRGIDLPPYWQVLPEGMRGAPLGKDTSSNVLWIEKGAGFGDGTHDTTQLCLMAIGYLARSGLRIERALDFGAGSGILSIALARSGAQVEAVEIDDRALEEARANARRNGVEDRISFRTTVTEPPRTVDLVVANILSKVLLDFAEVLCDRQSPKGRLILSGLLATDVPGILARYTRFLPAMTPDVYERGQWRAVVFSPRISMAH